MWAVSGGLYRVGHLGFITIVWAVSGGSCGLYQAG